MSEFSFEQWLTFVGVSGSVIAFVWGVLQFFVQRSLLRAKMRYEGEEILRREQIEIAKRIYQCVGTLCEPRDENEFEDAWYQLAELYQGAVYLLNDKSFRVSFNEFCDHFWENDEYGPWCKLMEDSKQLSSLQELADKLCINLNSYVRNEFARTGSVKIERSSSAKKKLRKKSDEPAF